MSTEFVEFPKIARLSRDAIVSEKIDGTNAQVVLSPVAETPDDQFHSRFRLCAVNGLAVFAGSRNRWLTPEADNFGFAAWVRDHAEGLTALGPGRHFGEWWGSGIQRGYGLPKSEKRWSLFNAQRWHGRGEEPRSFPKGDPRLPPDVTTEVPACCYVVPVLGIGVFTTLLVECALEELRAKGSRAAPGFTNPEGVVVFHVAGNVGFKKTIEKDETPNGVQR